MLRYLFCTSIIIAFFCTTSFGQDTFPLNELKFQHYFAQRTGDKTIYCLLGNGAFRTIQTNDGNAIISEWLHKHPNAKVIPISIFGEGTQRPNVYIWVVDGKENLNLFLVRNGVLPGSVMLDAVHFDILSKGTPERASIEAGANYARKMNPNLSRPKEFSPRRLISNSSYNAFLKELSIAENEAQTKKSGIWSDKYSELRNQ